MRILKLRILLNQVRLERNPSQSIALFEQLVLTMLRDKGVCTRALIAPTLFGFAIVFSGKTILY